MVLPSFITGNLWKIATGAVGIVAIVLVALLLAAQFENSSLTKQRNELTKQINDPITGYVAQLSQSRTNVVQLQTAIKEQKKKFDTAAAEANAHLKLVEARLAAAQRDTRAMEKRLNVFMATPPQGATPIDRLRDIDQRGMKEMVQ